MSLQQQNDDAVWAHLALYEVVLSWIGLPYVPLFEALSRFFDRKSRFLLR